MLLATGIWNLLEIDIGDRSTEYLVTLFVKLMIVALSGVAAGNTALCTVGRSGNDLHYRGYDILDFADEAEFEEVAYLLVHERLPTRDELKKYKARLQGLRGLPDSLKKTLEAIPKTAHPMDVLRTGVSVLGTLEAEKNDHNPYGAKAIAERINEEGVPLRGLIGLGGVARKSPYIMQVMASVMNMPIRIHKSEQTCALGAAMFAATVAGVYPRVEAAMETMGQGFDLHYKPEASAATHYEKRYQRYLALGEMIEGAVRSQRAETSTVN